jgi:hypothetical protein
MKLLCLLLQLLKTSLGIGVDWVFGDLALDGYPVSDARCFPEEGSQDEKSMLKDKRGRTRLNFCLKVCGAYAIGLASDNAQEAQGVCHTRVTLLVRPFQLMMAVFCYRCARAMCSKCRL